MPTDEQVELQELLSNPAPERPPKPTNDECATPVQGRAAGPGVTSDFCQWMVCPNDAFRPAGSTVGRLKPDVYVIEHDDHGFVFFRRPILTDTLIEIDDSASRRVIAGIQDFWKSRDKFTERGVLFKRGVLLWGPPGSGKTVTIAFLVRDLLAQGGLVIACYNPDLTAHGLRELRRIEPDRPLIVILEDVEEMIQRHGEHHLLGLLDGEHQVANVVHVASTNYPELLGERIVNRPSRFDDVIKIGMPSDLARRTYLVRSLDAHALVPPLDQWVKDTAGLSIAHLRELVVATQLLSRPYAETIERLKSMRVRRKSDSGTGLGF